MSSEVFLCPLKRIPRWAKPIVAAAVKLDSIARGSRGGDAGPQPADRDSITSLLRTESYGSASVTWRDRDAARRAASEAAKELAIRFPEVEGVLLFGSIARGDATPSSNVDLLVVLGTSELPFLDRIPRYTPAIDPLGVQVLPYTRAEFRRLRRGAHPLIEAALAEGEWLIGPPSELRGNV